jgi:opacity protein-like surface antigen
MKNFLPVSPFFFLVAAVSFSAHADPYIGLDGRVDAIAWHNSNSSYPEDTSGIGIHIGDRLSRNYGVELGYSNAYGDVGYSQTTPTAEKFSYRLSIRDFQLDNFAYLPLGESGAFQPFMTLGVAFSEGNARIRNSTTTTVPVITYTQFFQKQEVDWRGGFGIEYRLSQSISARFLARYQPYSFGSNLSGGATLGISINTAL